MIVLFYYRDWLVKVKSEKLLICYNDLNNISLFDKIRDAIEALGHNNIIWIVI